MGSKTSRVFVKTTGNGPKKLLLFHGFGQDHTALLPLADAVQDLYTCYLFDLYAHGESYWGDTDTPVKKADWKQYLGDFLNEHQIDTFAVLGFSLGARLAMASLEAFPERTVALYLIAPDGLRASPWYLLATGNRLTRKVFHKTITHPGFFFKLAGILHRWGWVDKRVYRIAAYYMTEPAKREQVYRAWVIFRCLKTSPARLAAEIRQHAIRTVIIVGKHDALIPATRIQGLIKRLKTGEYTLHMLPARHHQLLGEQLVHDLRVGG